MRKVSPAFAILLLLPWTAAEAYLGPGVGAGTAAVVLGIVSSIILAIVGFVLYPIKRLWRALRRPRARS
jgi:hypothetical protein